MTEMNTSSINNEIAVHTRQIFITAKQTNSEVEPPLVFKIFTLHQHTSFYQIMPLVIYSALSTTTMLVLSLCSFIRPEFIQSGPFHPIPETLNGLSPLIRYSIY